MRHYLQIDSNYKTLVTLFGLQDLNTPNTLKTYQKRFFCKYFFYHSSIFYHNILLCALVRLKAFVKTPLYDGGCRLFTEPTNWHIMEVPPRGAVHCEPARVTIHRRPTHTPAAVYIPRAFLISVLKDKTRPEWLLQE